MKIFTYLYVTYMTIIGDFEMEHHRMFSVSMTRLVCMLCFRCGQYTYVLYRGSTSDLSYVRTKWL